MISSIRVAHLVRTLELGGLENVVLDLVRSRTEKVIVPRVICLEQAGPLATQFEKLGISVTPLNLAGKSSISRIRALRRELIRELPDVLHTHNPAPHINGAIAAVGSGVKVLVHTKHGRNYVDSPYRVFQNWCASQLSSRIVCVSEDARHVATAVEKVSLRNVQVIHNGVDVEKFSIGNRQARSGSPKAIHVARLNPVKDQLMLLNAAKLVLQQVPSFRLEIVGDGPSRRELEQCACDLGIRESVEFLGMRAEIPELLVNADMFLLSSISEGISLTLLEAMAVGLPIVATNVGGNREVVLNDETGYLTPAKDPAAFSDAVIELCQHRDRSVQMGLLGRRRVEDCFSLTAMVSCYEGLYHDLLEKRT